MYDYDFNVTCDKDSSSHMSDGSMILMVLHYVLFCLGLLGMFKKS